ncbi:MAG: hypothetical protein ACKOPM_14845 [Novosphingobium sp.]
MEETVIDHPGPALLAHEARTSYGTVPQVLDGLEIAPGSSLLRGESFLLRSTTGYGLYYRKGQGVIVERAEEADPAEESLWLNGSVYAAIAAIHGFLPFHASAVAWAGKVHAFSGPSGAGKSTLAAALGQHGLPLFCDDTLVLDISDPARVLCLPGHKRLKLAGDAIDLTGAQAQERVGAMVDKSYALPPAGTLRAVLPLAGIAFLEEAPDLAIEPITGAQRIARLNDDHYTADLFAQARSEGPAERFARIAALAARIPMRRLARPRSTPDFNRISGAIASWIKQEHPA